MKRRRAYRLTLDDATRLERIVSVRLTPWRALALAVVILLAVAAAGVVVVMATPLRRALPGYMGAGERALAEARLLRLDSLSRVSEQRDAWLANVLRVIDTDRSGPAASAPAQDSLSLAFDPDSLLGSSPRERKFVASMREREKYNISVLAPLAAAEMAFVAPSPRAHVTSASRDSLVAILPLAPQSPVVAIADGTVVASYRAPYPERGVVVVQHDHGFVSSYSGLEGVKVAVGERLTAGQSLALHAGRLADGSRPLRVRLWHDSDPVVPARYFGDTQ